MYRVMSFAQSPGVWRNMLWLTGVTFCVQGRCASLQIGIASTEFSVCSKNCSENNIEVIFHKRGRVFHRGFQTREY